MSEPIFDETTENVYTRLPEHFRRSDTDYSLKRYLAGICAVQDEVTQLIKRFEYTPLDEGGEPGDTSDLTDPMTADLEWLPWLGQLVGVRLQNRVLDNSARDEVIKASNGYMAGTDSAIIAAVQTELIGSKSVSLKKRSTATGVGGPWDLLIQTLSSETLQNIIPENVIIPSSISNYDLISEPAGDTTRVLMTIASDPKFYKGKVVSLRAQPEDPLGPTDYSVYTPFYFEVDGGDPLTTMVEISYESGTNDNILVTAGIVFYQYSNGTYTPINASYVGSTTDTSLPKGSMQRFLGRSGAIAGTATHGRFYIRMKNVGADAEIHIGHFGARKEENDSWVPRSANPVQAVIERGAKPAGIKLWHTYEVSSWSDLENGGTTTWATLEGLNTWADVEEFSTE